MAQAKEEKRGLLAFWEGFKEGWSSSSATAQETPPPAPAEEVITAADEWDIDELQNAAVAAETIEKADERDMPEPMMTTAEPPQEKRGLAAFFEGFKDGWNNPPACGSGCNKAVYDDDELSENPIYYEEPILVPYDDRVWTDAYKTHTW